MFEIYLRWDLLMNCLGRDGEGKVVIQVDSLVFLAWISGQVGLPPLRGKKLEKEPDTEGKSRAVFWKF